MLRILNGRLTPFNRPAKLMRRSLMLCVVTTLTACSSVPPEPQFTNVRPQVAPLSAQVSQAIQPNSTDLLKRADLWLESSEQLLNCVTSNSCKSASN